MRKILLSGLALAVLAVIGLAVYLYTSREAILKRAIEEYGSAALQTKVSVDRVELELTDGRGAIHGFKVANPAGFTLPHALTIDRVDFSVDVGTWSAPIVVVKSIALTAPRVAYEDDGTRTNFDVLYRNSERAARGERPADASAKPAKPEEAARKLVVRQLSLREVQVEYRSAILEAAKPGSGAKTMRIGSIELRDLGEPDGMKPSEFGKVVVGALRTRLIALAVGRAVERVIERGLDELKQRLFGDGK